MNNRGQVLILFVMILPVVLLITVIGIDFLNISSLKFRTQNEIREIINYGFKENVTEENLNVLIDRNIDFDSKVLFKTDSEIKIKIVQNKKLFGKDIVLNYNYRGIKDNDKIVISEG
jgi:uncharacterized protein (UPF0333 family)